MKKPIILTLKKVMPTEVKEVPILNFSEEEILRKIVFWTDEYEHTHSQALTTKTCSDYFKIGHGNMLDILNKLESYGLIEKWRRQSAGYEGNGFDGSLFSGIKITEKGREFNLRRAQ